MCRTTPLPVSKKCCKASNRVKAAIKSSSKNLITKKAVRFSESNKVTFRHLMPEDLQQAWYQAEDFARFQQDRTATVLALRSAGGNLNALNSVEQCVRGLEMQATPEIFRYRTTNIKNTIQGVLKQQEVERQMGLKSSDPSMLGFVSSHFSKSAATFATAVAAIDAQRC